MFVRPELFGLFTCLRPRNVPADAPGKAAAAYWILLVATGSRFLCEAAQSALNHPALGWGVVLGGLGQVAGLALYFWTMWTRIRPVGSHIREAKGGRF